MGAIMNPRKIICIGLVMALSLVMIGCKRPGHRVHHNSSDYFQTHFQDESQFIVETIVADVAEQVYFAKYHRLPEEKIFFIEAVEAPESQLGTPIYNLLVDLDGKHWDLKTKLTINGPVWSPENYDAVTAWLARTVGLNPNPGEAKLDPDLLQNLTDADALTIERANENISDELRKDFSNAGWHEQAALILGAFLLREHSGDFFEIRTPLCRLTAHLAMARFFSGGDLTDNDGQVAGIVLQTLMNNQTAALTALRGVNTNQPALLAWARALAARNSSDYRPLQTEGKSTGLEKVERFNALTRSVDVDVAWGKLGMEQKTNASFVRLANQEHYSIELGHQLLALSVPLEIQELSHVYEESHSKKISRAELVSALNEMPARCFTQDGKNAVRVHVISWGLWAGFFQRHLCHAVQHDFNFLERKWGVHDEASAFATNTDAMLGGLRLYPFVRRFNSTEVADYRSSVDDGFKVTVASPQLVPAECWNYLCYEFSKTEMYQPVPNPHINEWHKHNPPPGTVYDLYPRLNHPSLTERGDAKEALDRLHEQAPYDRTLNYYLMRQRFNSSPTLAQATAVFGGASAYNVQAMTWMAQSVMDRPADYEVLMRKAAELNPDEYFKLGNYFKERKEEDKAAKYLETGISNSVDSVMSASHSRWLVNYYLQHGRTNDAGHIADFGGEVYSFTGLMAKAEYLEAIKNYSGAFEWLAKVEERYDDSGPLISFCLRYKALTGDTRFDDELKQRSTKIFPRGMEQVTLGDFTSPPTDGIYFSEENDSLKSAGLKEGDVVVAAYGIRVRNLAQYNFMRDQASIPELNLIVWQGDGFHEIKASPPNHRFGVAIRNYRKK